MYAKFKKKNKIHQSYKDFYNQKDLKDTEALQIINLTMDHFNAKGEIASPRAPCVVTTIDPEYIKDSSFRRRGRRFRMKTDILTLRTITRKKFMIYTTQQRYLEKQEEFAHHGRIHKHIMELQESASVALCKSESTVFVEMKQCQAQLEKLQKYFIHISEELKKATAENQRVLMEMQEIYGRFLFLLKLIGYFDEIIPLDAEEINLQSFDRKLGEQEVSYVTSYMKKIVRPYLARKNHLDADVWIKGYERTRQKIFNYNRRFNNLALLNHLVAIVLSKSEKPFRRNVTHPYSSKEEQFLKLRALNLNRRSLDILRKFEEDKNKDLIQIKFNAVLPVLLEDIELKLSQNDDNVAEEALKNNKWKLEGYLTKPSTKKCSTFKENHRTSTLDHVKKLQWHLMTIMQNLEKIPSEECTKIEKQLRKKIKTQKDASKRVLVKQKRLESWIEHFKKHALLRHRLKQ